MCIFVTIEEIIVEIQNDTDCSNEQCHAEIENLKKKIVECEKEISKGKDQYQHFLIQNLKKDLTIEDLKSQLKNNPYQKFNNNFSVEGLQSLTKMDQSAKKDSKFILTAMKDIYRDNLKRLEGKTYSGRKKEQITPKKLEVLRTVFNERLKNLPNYEERNSNFRKCVKNAIENINKTHNK